MSFSRPTGNELLYRVGWNLCSSVLDSLFRIEGYEAHFVPTTGAFLLAANHVSYLDPPAVGVCFRRPIHFFARDTLFRGPANHILRGVNAVPVNNRGGQDLGAIRGALEVLREGGGPAGLSRGNPFARRKFPPAPAGHWSSRLQGRGPGRSGPDLRHVRSFGQEPQTPGGDSQSASASESRSRRKSSTRDER